MIGKQTELDRTILEAIKDPLVHIVRNAIDHGLELPEKRAAAGKPRTGTLTLRAFHEGGHVVIDVSDDGAGMNLDAIRKKATQRGLMAPEKVEALSESEVMQLVFLPGFSTAEKVTNVSGRGVGMDVVKTNIERIGGTVDLSSSPGHGTRIRIKIPLTLAIVPALLVSSGGQRYAIPQVNLVELVRLEEEQAKTSIHRVRGTPVYRLRGRLLPLLMLNEQLKQVPEGSSTGRSAQIVVLQADGQQFGLVVDEVRDTEEIVVKPLSKELKSLSVFAGATIMGDGRVALILDVMGLVQRGRVLGAHKELARAEAKIESAEAANAQGERQALLLFGVSASGTMALPLSIVDRLEEFPRERFERAGQRSVIQYRGEILPVVEPFPVDDSASGRPVPVIVFARNNRRVGMVVGKILDVVEDVISVQRLSASSDLLGAAIIAGQITDVVDVEAVIRNHAPSLFAEAA